MRPAPCTALAVALFALPALAGSGETPSRELVFEARRGTADGEFPFLVRGDGYAAFVGGRGALWSGPRGALSLSFPGAREAAVPAAASPLAGRVLDLTGPRPVSRPVFGGLRVEGIFPGVDLAWRTEGGNLGYDLSFAAGADPAVASLEAGGARGLSVDPSGNLLVAVPGGVVRHSAPVAWQEDGGLRRAVRASFEPRGGNRFGFRVEGRDARLPLVIDPVVLFTTYLGGSGDDAARAVAVDAAGAVFLAGVTASADFPAVGGPGTSYAGSTDAFLAKIDGDGRLVFTAILGGTGDDEALAVALDGDGSPWISGVTSSPDFPLRAPFQGTFGGATDGFLAHVSADGGSLLCSTYLGGSGDDRAAALGFNGPWEVWVAGTTDSDEFPVTPDAVQPVPAGGADAFLARFSPDGAFLVHGTFFGGSGRDEVRALTVDSSGAATVAGATDSDDFPLFAAVQGSRAGGRDAFAFRIGATGAVSLSTYLGGSGDDEALAAAFDGIGSLAIAGVTRSPDFPVTRALQGAPAGGSDGFIATLTPGASGPVTSTYLGGTGDDEVRAVAFNSKGAVVAAGMTRSTDFPVRAAFQPGSGGGADGFVVRLSADGASLAWGTYLGGSGPDSVDALFVDGASTAVAAGGTGSPDLGHLRAFQPAAAGGADALAARLLLQPAAPSDLRVLGLSAVRVSLAWSDPSGGRSDSEVQRRFPGGAWEALHTAPAGTTEWIDTGVLPATAYEYRVRALLDGVPSDYSAPFTAGTLPTPVPAAPGAPVLEVLSGTSIALRWEDLGPDVIEFQVFRGLAGAVPSLVAALPPGTTAWVDRGLAADRSYTYRVRSIGVAGPSAPSGSATASTPATLSLEVLGGRRVDSAKFSRDSIDLAVRLSPLAGGSLRDPRTAEFILGTGDGAGTAIVSIPAGDAGWKERRGILTWKSPKGSVARATVVVDAATGIARIRIRRTNLEAAAAGAVRLWFRSGVDAGSVPKSWVVKKAGTLVL